MGSNWPGAIRLDARLTCPACGSVSEAVMPTDACQYFFDCLSCGALLKPKSGHCCVFCSYGDTPCPPKQCDCGASDP